MSGASTSNSTTDLPVCRPIDRAPTHPGELFREILDEHVGLSVSEAARRMDISRQSLHAVLRGESAVTADMALRFGRLVGGSPELYVQMQAKLDLWESEQKLQDVLDAIVPYPHRS
ncbi:MAG: HigA family addiction module antitoxin [Alphaproteobacteria bacterium]